MQSLEDVNLCLSVNPEIYVLFRYSLFYRYYFRYVVSQSQGQFITLIKLEWFHLRYTRIDITRITDKYGINDERLGTNIRVKSRDMTRPKSFKLDI